MSVIGEVAENPRGLGRIVLAHEAPIRFGAVTIDPARRRVAHDGGREDIIEPRGMQALVALVRAGGDILTPDELMAAGWGDVIGGEDALHPGIGRPRRLTEGGRAGRVRREA